MGGEWQKMTDKVRAASSEQRARARSKLWRWVRKEDWVVSGEWGWSWGTRSHRRRRSHQSDSRSASPGGVFCVAGASGGPILNPQARLLLRVAWVGSAGVNSGRIGAFPRQDSPRLASPRLATRALTRSSFFLLRASSAMPRRSKPTVSACVALDRGAKWCLPSPALPSRVQPS